MKIVVNDIAASTGGAMTVLRDFYNYVCQNDHENQWIFLLGEQHFAETENVKIITLPKVKSSHLRKLWFDFFSGKRYINKLQPDVVLSLQNIITFGTKAPQAVYLHQSIPFQTQKKFSFFKGSERGLAVIQHLIGWIIKRSMKKSDHVIVQTRWIRDAVCQQCKLPESKVTIHPPAIKPWQPAGETVFDRTSFFYPTADAIYKNNDCVFQASQILTKAGIAHQVALTLPPEYSRENVQCIGRLSYQQVRERYCRSVLVFPSYIESFGYPPAEARCAGTIVLAADTPFAREVLEGYENAYYFDPFQPVQLAALMKQVATGAVVPKEAPHQESLCEDTWGQMLQVIYAMKK